MKNVRNRSAVLTVVQRQEYRLKGHFLPQCTILINMPLTEYQLILSNTISGWWQCSSSCGTRVEHRCVKLGWKISSRRNKQVAKIFAN